MRLPFIREISPQIEKEINSFFAKLDFETKFLLINDTYSLKNVFKHKEQQQILHQYGVVYEISCNCGSSYIGQTSRNLITRINNHDPSSKTPQDTDVTRHLTDNPNHAVCFNNPIILARSPLAKIINQRNLNDSTKKSRSKLRQSFNSIIFIQRVKTIIAFNFTLASFFFFFHFMRHCFAFFFRCFARDKLLLPISFIC